MLFFKTTTRKQYISARHRFIPTESVMILNDIILYIHHQRKPLEETH